MARTKASVGSKISSGKSSKARCTVVPSTSTGFTSGSSDKASRSSGGNPVCPRETPKWQKPITSFFGNKHDVSHDSDGDGEAAGSSKTKSKRRNLIESEDDASPEKPKSNENPKNSELDETFDLEPLTGENSHKIQEYYTKGNGKGTKTKETKHVNSNDESGEDVLEGDGNLQDVNENSNGSGNNTDQEKSVKGKGIGKKTKGTKYAGVSEKEDEKLKENKGKESKHVDINGVSEKDDVLEGDDKLKKLSDNIDKENIDSNVDIASDKDNSIVGRKKRGREDKLEEDANINKKIKVN